MSEVIANLLGLPKDERIKALADPQVSQFIRSFLDSDPAYQGMPNGEKLKFRVDLGLSEVSPVEGPSPDVVRRNAYKMLGQLYAEPEQQIAASTTGAPTMDRAMEFGRTIQDILVRPVQQSLAQKNAVVETPLGNLDVGREGTTGSVVRGLLRSNPLTAGMVPEGEAPFLSGENAVRVATEAVLTYPLLPAKWIASSRGAMEGVMKAHPYVARAIADALVQTPGVSAWNVATTRIADAMREGRFPSIDGIAAQYGWDAAKTFGFMLGFGGAIHGVSRIADEFRPLTKGGVEDALSTGFRTLSAKRSTAEIPPAMPQPVEGNILDLAERAVNVADTAVTLPPSSRQASFLDTAEQRVAARAIGITRGKDPHLYDDTVLIKPNGNVEVTLPDPVLKTQFVPARDAIIGDIVLDHNNNMVRIVEKQAKGVTVQNQKGAKYYLPYEKIGEKADIPFVVGDSVYKQSGEMVTVRSFTSPEIAQVVDARGRQYAMQVSTLRSGKQMLEGKEAAERAAAGMQDPPPRGDSVFDILKGESGVFIPGKFIPGSKAARDAREARIRTGLETPITVTTQPGPEDFGSWRYWIDPAVTLLRAGKPQYDAIATMAFDAKAKEQLLLERANTMIETFQKMVGGGSRFAGASKDPSDRLLRAVSGVSLPTDVLTQAERSTVDAVTEFARKDVIPLINDWRTSMGKQPVPADYPWVFRLFPDVLFSGAGKGYGAGSSLIRNIRPSGNQNTLTSGSTIEIEGNFWQLLDRLYKYVAHESSWRPMIRELHTAASNEPSASNAKFLKWWASHLDNKRASPALGEMFGFTSWIDKKLADLVGRKAIQVTDPSGNIISLEAPAPLSLAELTVDGGVYAIKSLHYAATIGANARTVLLNLSQPITDAIGRLPGTLPQNLIWTAYGYAKGIAALTSKESQALYHDKGVLTSLEDLFLVRPPLSTTGGGIRNAYYTSSWLWNNFTSMLFLGMKAAETVNRVGVYETRRGLTEQIAREKGLADSIIQSPEFQRDIARLSTYASNTANFLYGKGFKSPAQTGHFPNPFGMPINVPGIGELIYMFNTFGVKHLGNMMLMAKQYQGHVDAVNRMTLQGASPEFANYLQNLEPPARKAVLAAVSYQWGLSSLLFSTIGLASLAGQLSPTGLLPGNPVTPIIKNTAEAASYIWRPTPDNLVKAAKILARTFTPGYTMAKRAFEGTTVREKLFSSVPERRGEPPSFTDYVLGTPGATKGY